MCLLCVLRVSAQGFLPMWLQQIKTPPKPGGEEEEEQEEKEGEEDEEEIKQMPDEQSD